MWGVGLSVFGFLESGFGAVMFWFADADIFCEEMGHEFFTG